MTTPTAVAVHDATPRHREAEDEDTARDTTIPTPTHPTLTAPLVAAHHHTARRRRAALPASERAAAIIRLCAVGGIRETGDLLRR